MNNIKFEHNEDKLFIKALLRSAKEANVLYINGQTIKDIYKRCLMSRKGHPSESIYSNAMYWATDSGFYNADFIYRILLISSIDKNKLTKSDIIDFRRILCRFFSNAFNNNLAKLLKNIYVLDMFDLAANNLELENPYAKDVNFIIDSLNKYKDVINKLPL